MKLRERFSIVLVLLVGVLFLLSVGEGCNFLEGFGGGGFGGGGFGGGGFGGGQGGGSYVCPKPPASQLSVSNGDATHWIAVDVNKTCPDILDPGKNATWK